jgi:hypothetical protein
LTASQLAAVRAESAAALKTNRYDAAPATLHLTEAETAAYQQQIGYWTDYFRLPSHNGGVKVTSSRIRPSFTSLPPLSPGPLGIASIKGCLGVRGADR